MAILIAALLIRCIQFGNPVVQIDEQFYLLVGDRMLHGALPYVQFWDRKPFGIFALYAAIRSLGGEGILAYQLIATLFAATTAFIVYRISRRAAGMTGALFSALIYLAYLSVNGGDGGQAPVFYNLIVAAAALMIVRWTEVADVRPPSLAGPFAAMLFLGFALQVKYTVIFEGVYFGLYVLHRAYRAGRPPAQTLSFALIAPILAVLPTVLVGAYYWHIGHFAEFWFCNFQSVLLRPSPGAWPLAQRLLSIALHLLPLAVPAALARRQWMAVGPVGTFVMGWCVASIVGLLAFGTYFDHYSLPLVLPLAVAGAPIYDDLARGLRLGKRVLPIGIVVLAAGMIFVEANTIGLHRHRGDGSGARRIASIIRPHAARCAFVFAGDPILYHLSGACIPTAYNFPTLFSEMGDSVTLGIDWQRALRRTLDSRPGYIVLFDPPPKGAANAVAWAMVRDEVRQHYVLVDREPLASRTDLVFARRDP
ncbi:MAG: glycosyltransferase family 39 protein [Sphingomonas sp.]